MAPLRAYLAGPEVFLSDALALGDQKKAICARHGFDGRFPLDVEPSPATIAERGLALAIFEVCETMMRECDLVIANMTPFRGVSMDVGTAVEIGFMYALGKPVFGYTNRAPDYGSRVEQAFGATDEAVESFGLADNLMCEGPIQTTGSSVFRRDVVGHLVLADMEGFEECVRQAAEILKVKPAQSRAETRRPLSS